MARITEDLVRKRAEHNNGEISTLEEVSLHQQDIVKIENLDKWCRKLKILYLQSNLISRIENLSRLKNLEYVNLALNNIEHIENLENCESLKKLDLTVNFVGTLTDVESLKNLLFFEDLYLTGNPCADFSKYREFVIGTLPGLKSLDGQSIQRSERILATQNLTKIKSEIISQQENYLLRREEEKVKAKLEDTSKNNDHETRVNDEADKNAKSSDVENENSAFWQEKVAYTPESRIAIHEELKKARDKTTEDDQNKNLESSKKNYVSADGRMLNVNESKLDFVFSDEDPRYLVLELHLWKHLDTSLVNLDLHPSHVRVTVKGKIFQLVLPEPISVDQSEAKRSQVTGHLVITMPRVDPIVKSVTTARKKHGKAGKESTNVNFSSSLIENRPSLNDLFTIYDKGSSGKNNKKDIDKKINTDFMDDPEVPPLI